MVNLGEAYRKLIGKTNKRRTKDEQRTNKERTKNEQRTNKERRKGRVKTNLRRRIEEDILK